MVSRPRSLAFLSLLLLAPFANAQPPQAIKPVLPVHKPAFIQPEAKQMLLAFIEKYQALKSYSDTTVAQPKGEGPMTARMAARFGFQMHMDWQRPDHSRFEGTNADGHFLAVSDGKTLSVQTGNYPDAYAQRRAGVWAIRDGLMDVNLNMGSQSYFFERGVAQRLLEDQKLTSLTLGDDAEVEGVPCHVLQSRSSSLDGTTENNSIFIGVADGLMHRWAEDFGQGNNRLQIVETHSDIQLNPTLDASTWDFTPPAAAKRVNTFMLRDPDAGEPKVKVGDEVPTFTAQTVDGQTLSLAGLRGNVVLLYFYADRAGEDAAKLADLARKEGARGLKVVAVGYSVKPDKLLTDAEGKPLPYPFVISGTTPETDLMAIEGNRALGWIYLIDRQGKLVRIGKDLSDLEFSGDIETTLAKP